MMIEGRVSSGLGRAHVFMSQAHYQNQFKSILGRTAWPGTLNLEVEGESFATYLALRGVAGVESRDADQELLDKADLIDVSSHHAHAVAGFLRDGVSFGGATAFLATIQTTGGGIPCAVLIPDLTRHVDVVEVIAGQFLRESMDLEDGDSLTLLLS